MAVRIATLLLISCVCCRQSIHEQPPPVHQVDMEKSVPPPPPPAPPASGSPYRYPIFRTPIASRSGDPIPNPEVPPVKISGEQPQYTDEARRARVQGIVILDALVERDGRVSAARVLKPLPFGLDQRALDAVLTWKFKPALQNGKAVRAIQQVSVAFNLPDQ